jgi:lipopolysaccharide export LptBFGC system permease protein LptF
MYLKDFFIMLVMITVGLSLIFCLLDVIEKIDDFKPDAFSAGQVTLYAVLRLPSYLLYLLPVSVLISSLFTFSQAYRRFEIPAIKAAGGKLRAFFYPFIVTGILISLFAFMINEGIAPDFSRRALAIKNELKGKTKKYAFREGSMWLKSTTGDPVKIDLFVFDKRLVHGIDIFVLGDAVLRERISAEKAFWNGSIWSLEQVTRYDFDSGTIHELKTLDYHNLEAPEIFAEKIKKPEEMNISELYRYAERLKNAGFRNVHIHDGSWHIIIITENSGQRTDQCRACPPHLSLLLVRLYVYAFSWLCRHYHAGYRGMDHTFFVCDTFFVPVRNSTGIK